MLIEILNKVFTVIFFMACLTTFRHGYYFIQAYLLSKGEASRINLSSLTSGYNMGVELFTTVLLVVISLGLGVGLLVYGIRGTRESQARDGRTYKRGRL